MKRVKLILFSILLFSFFTIANASSIITTSKINGDELIVDIYVNADKSFTTLSVPISYDKNILSLEWNEKQEMYNIESADNIQAIYIKRLVCSSSKELKKGKHKLATFTFKIIDKSKLSDTYIIINDGELVSNNKLYDVTGTAISFNNDNNKLTVSTTKITDELETLSNTYEENTIAEIQLLDSSTTDKQEEKKENIIQEVNDNVTESPHTGVGIPAFLLILLIIGYVLINKKNNKRLFYKI